MPPSCLPALHPCFHFSLLMSHPLLPHASPCLILLHPASTRLIMPYKSRIDPGPIFPTATPRSRPHLSHRYPRPRPRPPHSYPRSRPRRPATTHTLPQTVMALPLHSPNSLDSRHPLHLPHTPCTPCAPYILWSSPHSLHSPYTLTLVAPLTEPAHRVPYKTLPYFALSCYA